MYEINYRPQAKKALLKLQRNVAGQFRSAFVAIANNQASGLDIKPLAGRPGFRLRIGQWRAVYTVDHGRLLVVVIKIASRGDIYK